MSSQRLRFWEYVCLLLKMLLYIWFDELQNKKISVDKTRINLSWLCTDYVLIELISFASNLQQTRRPVGAAESKCQMRSFLCLGAVTLQFSHLSNEFKLLETLLWHFCIITGSVFTPSQCILILQYAPLSLRPLTCEVKAGHRWGPREQGCIQFQHPVEEGIILALYSTWYTLSLLQSIFDTTWS